MELNPNTLNIIIASIFALICTCLQIAIQEQLEDSSADYIEWLQTDRTSFSEFIFKSFGFITQLVYVGTGVILFLSFDRHLGFLTLSFGLIGAASSTLLKLMYAQPRPYWKYSHIAGLDCATDWGTPSGHALSAGCVLFYIGPIWINSSKRKLWKVCVIIFAVFITGFNRNYLGAHFYSQVVLGYSYSLLFISIMAYPYIYEKLRKISKEVVYFTHGLAGVMFLTASLLYCFRKPYWDEEWGRNYSEKCGGKLHDGKPMISDFTQTSYICIVAGLSLGYFKLEIKGLPKFNIKNLAISLGIAGTCAGIILGCVFLFSLFLDGIFLAFAVGLTGYFGGFSLGNVVPLLIYRLLGVKIDKGEFGFKFREIDEVDLPRVGYKP
ncbi:unnamed protein product [Blepharisma stoltei]|uniref:Phosphatidic acid phosphatase type 2/haloperoxidase domain-containing protein n=1 Tax=Blepharisma stoltei TaxID=1481888 RepID=A0AAU9KC54_9CILI|nr:unnamed protein product [Blepharisma stoltei]